MSARHTGRKEAVPEVLLVDVGNTRVKWLLLGSSNPRDVIGESPTAGLTAKSLSALARKYPRQSVILACVVPKLLPAFRKVFRGRLLEVNAGMPRECLGPVFRFAYPKPAELGADRIAAAIAVEAWKQYPAIVVACGTATAFTVIDAKGRLCGGAIAPGLQAQLDALLGATAQLPAVDLRMPRLALAKSTRDAIRAGVVLGFQGGIKETVARLSAELPRGKKPRVILTGGNANLARPAFSGKVTLRPLLVLQGLFIIASRLCTPEP